VYAGGVEVAKRLETRRPFEYGGSADNIDRRRNARQANSMRSNSKRSATEKLGPGTRREVLSEVNEGDAEVDDDNGGRRGKIAVA
jgi:hypothetical protein